ncbi:penicillin-binding protein 1B [Pasteurella skyensis]|uniref:Penicillin-binding protein 1B n=1 Tax=Phocoenobacter skyensis TaxID=97481 RepID=A0AAJ6NAY1_9PAST|nr:penicillin-binding protein 1B [Pasteurella skyensis]MDP8162678.1 penicillin-binding protein 1B [Pasteurella skyensis]MDP8173446.1 penicillin-binding protein 1B [Pasteurella skyensis]MDP8177635.1 penicillin-binding protein 1B [Pasteurella skyensis]MDP8178780.1 penicillin-binding protein 1B [Pasteurella skyensis]MDP8183080.1 penicillin-binding protein 1B [Pasteurella skyensis]
MAKTKSKKVKKTTKKASIKQNKKQKKALLAIVLKLMLTGVVCLFFYGIYLDSKIRTKMDGQIWQLPAEVYSRIDHIRIKDHKSLDEIILTLHDNGYRRVSQVVTPGDFKVEDNSLLLIRRAFPFPTKPEAQRMLRLRFKQNHLTHIEDLVRVRLVDEFRLDPKLIAILHSENDEDRQAIHLKMYPRLLIEALLLTEDKHFYEHEGISPLGIIRALITNYRAGRRVQGGSTLTQQLVKNLFLTPEKSLVRKINEALMSVILDFRYSKNRILETYLNEIYLGQNGNYQIHGFALASQFYFGRPIQEISLDKLALLVGIVKGPSLYNPWRNPKYAIKRRNIVLKVLLNNKLINKELYTMLAKRPLGVKPKGKIYRQQPAFMQALNKELKQKFGKNIASKLSGSKIFTTLDREQQRATEMAVINGIAQLENSSNKVKKLQSAMIVAEYSTGKIRAIVGGVETQFAGFNRAIQAKRQIGSLVKPSIYAIALSDPQNFRLNTPIDNSPITIKVKGSPPWRPRNYNNKFSGSVMLMDALVRSMNIPTVNIGMKVGLKKVIAKQKEMGWDNAKIPPYPATLLGSYTISPYEVTKSYQVLANAGEKLPLTTLESIISENGRLIYKQNKRKAKRVLPKEATIQTLYAMQQAIKRGTGRSLQQNFAHLNLAGKTGTTNNARDTWFVGIDGKNLTTVWLGKDNYSDTYLTGSSGALFIYKQYLKHTVPTRFKLPTSPSIQWVGINSYGSWDCDSNNKIPVWRNQGQSYCTSPRSTPQKPKPSIWDILTLQD